MGTNLSMGITAIRPAGYHPRMDADRDAIRELIMEAQRHHGKTVRELAALAGVSHAAVSKARNRQAVPEPATLRKLAPWLGVSEDRLLELAGHRSPPRQPRRLRSRDSILDELMATDAVEVPFYEVTASASPRRSIFEGAPIDYGYLPDRGRYRRGRIQGITVRDNCLAPRILDGDRVYIDTQADYEPGDTVLAVANGELHLKRLRPLGDGWELAPDDGDPAIPVTEDVVILGKYIGTWRPAF